LDASFLAVESPAAHMHVGWVAHFAATGECPVPSFRELRGHIDRRIGRAPRYRQKLAAVPLGVNAPEWVDDPAFSIDRHVYWANGSLEDLVDEVMSIPLRRDRPLWEIWVYENAADGEFALVGKAHHCMVDGLAALELASLILDPTLEPVEPDATPWEAEDEPAGEVLLARGLRDLLGDQLDLVRHVRRAAGAPGAAAKGTAVGALRVARALDQLLRPAPASVLNGALSPLRRLATTLRPLEDLRTIKHAHGTTINDVVLASVAGGIRTYLLHRGEEPGALKVMVPVNVRQPHETMGNHISFVFAELPCHEPDPLGRLYQVHTAMSRAKREGEPEGSDLVLKSASYTPAAVQLALSRIFASPRAFNLVVSNIPGPTEPTYMLGCRLRAVYPIVPLAEHHAVSVGMLTVHDQACIGVYADREALPDVKLLAQNIDDAITELLAGTDRAMESGGSLLARVLAVSPEPLEEHAASRHAPAPDPIEGLDRRDVERELQHLADGRQASQNGQADQLRATPPARGETPVVAGPSQAPAQSYERTSPSIRGRDRSRATAPTPVPSETAPLSRPSRKQPMWEPHD
jgi:WS/DGAT/MGAT family acyltransferase